MMRLQYRYDMMLFGKSNFSELYVILDV